MNWKNKIKEWIDDFAAQLGLQPKPVPVRVKNSKDKRK